jgi:hypothetical protein
MTMLPTGNHTGASGVVATADAPDERAVAIVWTHEAAARRKVTRGGGMRQQATRQPAGEREANGRRGASGQKVTGP